VRLNDIFLFAEDQEAHIEFLDPIQSLPEEWGKLIKEVVNE